VTEASLVNGIGQLRERSLHAALCEWCCEPGDAREVEIDGYRIDVLRGDLLIEVQTGNFGALRAKLSRLLQTHPVLLVHPIPLAKWIVRLPVDPDGVSVRRKSPRHGRVTDLYDELVHIPTLTTHPRLQLMVVYIREEEYWKADGKGSWRRKGVSIVDRRLLEIVDTHTFGSTADHAALLPEGLDAFTARDLSQALKIRLPQARRVVYCLHKMGELEQDGKRGRERVWRRAGTHRDDSGRPASTVSAHP